MQWGNGLTPDGLMDSGFTQRGEAMPEEDSTNNPHDRSFRRFYAETENMRQLVTWRLPSWIFSELNLSSLQPTQESFIDKTLREGLSDLVLNVELASGEDAYVALLSEHCDKWHHPRMAQSSA